MREYLSAPGTHQGVDCRGQVPISCALRPAWSAQGRCPFRLGPACAAGGTGAGGRHAEQLGAASSGQWPAAQAGPAGKHGRVPSGPEGSRSGQEDRKGDGDTLFCRVSGPVSATVGGAGSRSSDGTAHFQSAAPAAGAGLLWPGCLVCRGEGGGKAAGEAKYPGLCRQQRVDSDLLRLLFSASGHVPEAVCRRSGVAGASGAVQCQGARVFHVYPCGCGECRAAGKRGSSGFLSPALPSPL